MKCSQTQNCISPKGRFSKDTLMESICFVLQVRFFLATMYACSKQGREIHPLSTTLSNSNTHTHTHTHTRAVRAMCWGQVHPVSSGVGQKGRDCIRGNNDVSRAGVSSHYSKSRRFLPLVSRHPRRCSVCPVAQAKWQWWSKGGNPVSGISVYCAVLV